MNSGSLRAILHKIFNFSIMGQSEAIRVSFQLLDPVSNDHALKCRMLRGIQLGDQTGTGYLRILYLTPEIQHRLKDLRDSKNEAKENVQ